MEQSPENFESLQALLRLKRYEQPPPRFFNEFSGNVIARIQAGEARVTRRWWERFGIDLRPVLTAGGAAAAFGVLFLNAGFSIENDGQALPPTAPVAVLVSQKDSPALPVNSPNVSSTTPEFNAAGTMFNGMRPQVMPVNY
jgi:hypothetical protein